MYKFYLTRRALLYIEGIFNYSLKNWGEIKADEYLSNLYKDLNRLANKNELGELRKFRSRPFLMYPSGKHYIVYEHFKDDIIIITVIHQVRNIENIINEFGSVFYNEIEFLKANIEK